MAVLSDAGDGHGRFFWCGPRLEVAVRSSFNDGGVVVHVCGDWRNEGLARGGSAQAALDVSMMTCVKPLPMALFPGKSVSRLSRKG